MCVCIPLEIKFIVECITIVNTCIIYIRIFYDPAQSRARQDIVLNAGRSTQ